MKQQTTRNVNLPASQVGYLKLKDVKIINLPPGPEKGIC